MPTQLWATMMAWYVEQRRWANGEVKKYADPPSDALLPDHPPNLRCAAAPPWHTFRSQQLVALLALVRFSSNQCQPGRGATGEKLCMLSCGNQPMQSQAWCLCDVQHVDAGPIHNVRFRGVVRTIIQGTRVAWGRRRLLRTLVLDLDEVLVHSDWTRARGWRTFKRPGVEDFLKTVSSKWEVRPGLSAAMASRQRRRVTQGHSRCEAGAHGLEGACGAARTASVSKVITVTAQTWRQHVLCRRR